jgi:sterol desaturase/sphingolipid hydroxylase (fatty acid hydroxylase superfamily)
VSTPSKLSSRPSLNIAILEVVQASLIENITYVYIPFHKSSLHISSYLYDILCFIPLSFMFEVIFDFFHYWTHRSCHMLPWLYRQTHKKHHEHNLVSPHTTYHQHYLDIILTNSFPFILTYWLFPFRLSLWQLHMILVYKEFVEISGHCGRILYPASSFPQFIWLPRVLGISLYAEDHHIHHTKRVFNFGKRFSLWDKLFNTYHSGIM